jgi:ATP:ADP antiporter, AAA family
MGVLKMLLRDPDDEVKRNAIHCAATNYNISIILELLEYLEHEEFSDLTVDVLATIGNDTIEPLVSLFQKSDIDTVTQRKIIRIIGNIATDQAFNFLFDKLVYPNKWIVLEVVNALIEKKYKLHSNDKGLINTALHNTIGAAAWLLAMDVSLQDINRLSPVKRAITEEYEVTLDLLFKLLQLKYSEGVIMQAKKYLTTDTANEQRELSVEMLGAILDKDIKDYLFPLLHNNQKKEKVLQLQSLYPIEQKDTVSALREIINSDLGHISLWTKACALDAYIDMQDISQSEDVYAHVFNSEPLLSEIAFFGIYKWNKEASAELFARLPNPIKKKFRAVKEKGEHFKYHLLFHKVISLQHVSYFEKVKGHYLIPFAEVLNEYSLEPGGSTYIQCSEEEVLPVFMVPYGEITLIDVHKRKFKLNRNYLYGLGLYAGGITLKASTDAVVYLAKPEQVGSLVLNHEELSDALHKYIQNSNFY